MATSRFLAHHLSLKHPEIGPSEEIKPVFDRGISYAITGLNTGRENGYAFAGAASTALGTWTEGFAPDYSLVSDVAKT